MGKLFLKQNQVIQHNQGKKKETTMGAEIDPFSLQVPKFAETEPSDKKVNP